MRKQTLAMLTASLLAGCGSTLFPAPNGHPEYQVIPPSPRIGEPFTLSIDAAASRSTRPLSLPDGTYRVLLSNEVVRLDTNGDVTAPTLPPTNKQAAPQALIGTIELKGGKGQAQFVLQTEYENGIQIKAGQPIGLNFTHSDFIGGVGFWVAP